MTMTRLIGLAGVGVVCLGVSGCTGIGPWRRVTPDLLPDGRPRPTLVAPRRGGLQLDGKLADWHGVPFTTVTPQNGVFDLESTETDSASDISYRFAVCHDGEALYVAVEVTDDVLMLDSTAAGETHAKAWQDDAVEVFLDGNHNRAPHARVKDRSEYPFGGEFSLVSNNAATSNCTAWPDSFGKADHWEGATSREALPGGGHLLRYEYRLTWRVMGGDVRPGDTIGFTIGIQDDDDGGNRDHALYWLGITPHCWKDENGWGNVVLAR
ncbi:MAG: hypothetical protein HN742_34930 [Lentisphaerae bacterium]|nr:hypothetical protein [Lentisphaerota bacterium]MBT4822940.1 hypothetical protein [Lentisphaerota bacterium]MBT5609236.1 hypothetical protein [Lentisphaerota bacterium]MBT7059885.1 hypothetical protein [Lentisphaerota bacterium]MBT7847118.1 hypothetical protein [Lentisphaerota bacterium]